MPHARTHIYIETKQVGGENRKKKPEGAKEASKENRDGSRGGTDASNKS
jgi:hypothetical protein